MYVMRQLLLSGKRTDLFWLQKEVNEQEKSLLGSNTVESHPASLSFVIGQIIQ